MEPGTAAVGPVAPLAVALVGPTAVGKTALALDLAERLGAEIVSADSRQVYRGLDIGTAKPPPALRRGIPHHLLDVAEPDEVYTVALYQRQGLPAFWPAAGCPCWWAGLGCTCGPSAMASSSRLCRPSRRCGPSWSGCWPRRAWPPS